MKLLPQITCSALAIVAFSGLFAAPASADPESTPAPVTEVLNPSETLIAARADLARLENESSQMVEAYNKAVEDKKTADADASKAKTEYNKAKAEAATAKTKLGEYASEVYKSGSAGVPNFNGVTDIISSGDATKSARSVEKLTFVQDRKATAVDVMEAAELKANDAKSKADKAQATASKAATDAETAAKDAERLSTETAAAVKLLESDELEKERKAKEEAEALAAFQAWEASELAAQERIAAAAAASGAALPVAAGTSPISMAAPSEASGAALDFALAQIGKPYAWGSAGPDGFDCSGLTSAAYAHAGIKLPRNSAAQAGAGTPVAISDLQPGDLVFFNSPVSHVGMYVGDGMMVHASKPGDTIKIAKFWSNPVSAVRVG